MERDIIEVVVGDTLFKGGISCHRRDPWGAMVYGWSMLACTHSWGTVAMDSPLQGRDGPEGFPPWVVNARAGFLPKNCSLQVTHARAETPLSGYSHAWPVLEQRRRREAYTKNRTEMSFRWHLRWHSNSESPQWAAVSMWRKQKCKGPLFTFLIFWDVSYAVDLGLANLKSHLWQQAGKLQGVFLCWEVLDNVR